MPNWEKTTSPEKPIFFIKRRSSAAPGTISINLAPFTGDKAFKALKRIKSDPNGYADRLRKKRFPDAEMLKYGDTYLGGFPAYLHTISYSVKNLDRVVSVVTVQIFCIKEGRMFLVNFETQVHTFERVYKEFETILASFNFR